MYRCQQEFLAGNEDPFAAEASEREEYRFRLTPKEHACVLDSFLQECPECGSKRSADYRNVRKVILPCSFEAMPFGVGDALRLTSRICRCHNASCDRFLTRYRPEIEGRIALPKQKLSLLLIKSLWYFLEKGLTSRRIQTRLSHDRSINLTHATIDNALAAVRNRQATEDLSESLHTFLQRQPHQRYLVLDIFAWKWTYADKGEWVVRNCLSGDVLFTRTRQTELLIKELFLASSVPDVHVLSPAQSSIPFLIRRLFPGAAQRRLPNPTWLSDLPPRLRWTLGVPVSHSRVLRTL